MFNLVTNSENCFTLVQNFYPLSLIFYSHLVSVVSSLLIGLFVFIRDRKSLVARNLLALSITFAFWILFSYIDWTSSNTLNIMFTWSFFGILTILLFIFSLELTYAFLNKEAMGFNGRFISGLLALPVILLTPTNFNLAGITDVDCNAMEGTFFTNYFFIYGLFIAIWISILIIRGYRKAEEEFKKQVILFGFGIEFFLVSFFITGIISSWLIDYTAEFYGLFGMAVFMGFLAYIIVRFKAFNIKLLGAEALVVILVVLIASQFAFIQNNTNRILTGITLLLALVFGYFLVKSVKKENERKEELQVMSNRLATANDQLRKLDNAKSEFISIASHQLRTPLTAVKGFISLLLEGSYGKIESPDQIEVLNKVYQSNERLVNLVEDLLNVSRMESGRMEFKFGQWKMENICQEIIDTFVLKAKGNNLYLEYKKPEVELPEVTIDGLKVREVISNLVDNAVKYTPKGGVKVSLELCNRNDGECLKGEHIRVTVADTGIGVPQSELPYLFAKFSRGKDTSRLNTGGTGLGLYVGKSMIENNGGRVWAESDGQDRGSRFIVEIPVHQSEEILKRWG